MRRKPVQSHAIASIGFDAATNQLEIEYIGGDVYVYFAVPASVHQALMESDSVGRFVNEHIKPHYAWQDGE